MNVSHHECADCHEGLVPVLLPFDSGAGISFCSLMARSRSIMNAGQDGLLFFVFPCRRLLGEMSRWRIPVSCGEVGVLLCIPLMRREGLNGCLPCRLDCRNRVG